MQAFMLKAAATALTLLAALASAAYVGGHVKNQAAPLHPQVTGVSSDGGSLSVSPGLRPSSSEPVTSTYAS